MTRNGFYGFCGFYRFYRFRDGLEALERLAELPAVQLLITDLTLPVIDGVELIRRARARVPEMAALLISGYPVEELRLDGAAVL